MIIGAPHPRPRAPLDRTTASPSIIFSADPPISVAALNLTYWPSSPSDQLSPDPAKAKIARTHTRNSLKVNFV